LSKSHTYEPHLDGLRAIAVTAVMAFHCSDTAIPGGWAGVDLFFTLSGYLITKILAAELARTGRIDILNFTIRRALRLMPAFWTVTAFVLAAAIAMHEKPPVFQALLALTYNVNWVTMLGAMPLGPFGHTWSLAAEEQFYLIWPAVFVLVGLKKARLVLLAALLAAIAWRLHLVLHGADEPRIYFGFDTRADCIIIGSLAALTPVTEAAAKWLRLLAPAALAAFCGFCLFVKGTVPVMLLGFDGIGVLSVILILGSGSVLRKLLASRPMAFTGKISYGLYLWHWPLWLEWHHGRGYSSVLIFAIAYVLAAGSYFIIEAPFRRWKSQGLGSPALARTRYSLRRLVQGERRRGTGYAGLAQIFAHPMRRSGDLALHGAA
jgi:peptidoglycan/LPS O-acetylase OafA/YrhL